MTDGQQYARDAREFQADQMNRLQEALLSYVDEIPHATKCQDLTGLAWDLHLVYSLTGRLPECFATMTPHTTEDVAESVSAQVDMDGVRRWTTRLYAVGDRLIEALGDLHHMQGWGGVFGSTLWETGTEKIIRNVSLAVDELESVRRDWMRECDITKGDGA